MSRKLAIQGCVFAAASTNSIQWLLVHLKNGSVCSPWSRGSHLNEHSLLSSAHLHSGLRRTLNTPSSVSFLNDRVYSLFSLLSHNNHPRKHRGGRQCIPTEKVEILLLHSASFWIILLPNLLLDPNYSIQISYEVKLHVHLYWEEKISNLTIFSLSLVSHKTTRRISGIF